MIYTTQLTIPHETAWYVDESGYLDMDKLLTAFQEFFRRNFDSWVDGFQYREAAPQLLLQAFLQRVVNSGGWIHREYGLGRQRTDLLVLWFHEKKKQEIVLELKIRYGSTEKTITNGIQQTLSYMDKCTDPEGFLLIFDRRKKVTWEEKIFKETRAVDGKEVTVFGM